MKKLLITAFLMAAIGIPALRRPPLPPSPGPTKQPVDCKVQPRPCLPPILPGK